MKKQILTIIALLFVSSLCFGQKFSAGLNMADALFLGTVSGEAQYGFSKNWSVAAGGEYNPWTYLSDTPEQFERRRRGAAVGVRWWPWHIYSGWWLSADAKWQEYNEAHILTKSVEAEEGDRYGLRVGFGYTVMINSWLNIDFGIKGWGGYRKYTVYACQKCGSIVEQGGKSFFLPDQALVSIMFVF